MEAKQTTPGSRPLWLSSSVAECLKQAKTCRNIEHVRDFQRKWGEFIQYIANHPQLGPAVLESIKGSRYESYSMLFESMPKNGLAWPTQLALNSLEPTTESLATELRPEMETPEQAEALDLCLREHAQLRSSALAMANMFQDEHFQLMVKEVMHGEEEILQLL